MAFDQPAPLPPDHVDILRTVDKSIETNKQWAIEAKFSQRIGEHDRARIEASAKLNIELAENEAKFKAEKSLEHHHRNLSLSDIYVYFYCMIQGEYETKHEEIYYTGCAVYAYIHYNHNYHQVGCGKSTVRDRLSIWRARTLIPVILAALYHPVRKVGDVAIVFKTINDRTTHASLARYAWNKTKEFSLRCL